MARILTAGFQIATNNIGEGIGAAKMAEEAGATWMDLNCGCPIYGAAWQHLQGTNSRTTLE